MSKVAHLRLVSSNDCLMSDVPSCKEGGGRRTVSFAAHYVPEQLTLPYLDPFTMVCVKVDGIYPEKFTTLLESLGAKWIIDARTNPRLDVLGGTRKYAFDLFQRHCISYLDPFIRFGITTYQSVDANPSLWGEKVGRIIKKSSNPVGPFTFLFDNQKFMEDSSRHLPSALGQTLGRNISSFSPAL